MAHHDKSDKKQARHQNDERSPLVEGETSPEIQGRIPDPGRTPGQAEGNREDVKRALRQESGEDALGESPRDPGRTPGQAEGTREDVEQALRKK